MKQLFNLCLVAILLTGCNFADITKTLSDLTSDEPGVTAPVTPLSDEVKPLPTPPIVKARVTEQGTFSGYGNPAPQPRSLFRFKHPGDYYGTNVEVSFDGKPPEIVINGASRKDLLWNGLWKPESENDHKLAIHGGSGLQIKTCVITYTAK